MATQEHLDMLKQGKEAWNQWRQAHQYLKPDFEGANLRKADFIG